MRRARSPVAPNRTKAVGLGCEPMPFDPPSQASPGGQREAGTRSKASTTKARATSIGPNAIAVLRPARRGDEQRDADQRAEQEAGEDPVVDVGPAEPAEVARRATPPRLHVAQPKERGEMSASTNSAAYTAAAASTARSDAATTPRRRPPRRRAATRRATAGGQHQPVGQAVVLVVDDDQRRAGQREHDERRQQRAVQPAAAPASAPSTSPARAVSAAVRRRRPRPPAPPVAGRSRSGTRQRQPGEVRRGGDARDQPGDRAGADGHGARTRTHSLRPAGLASRQAWTADRAEAAAGPDVTATCGAESAAARLPSAGCTTRSCWPAARPAGWAAPTSRRSRSPGRRCSTGSSRPRRAPSGWSWWARSVPTAAPVVWCQRSPPAAVRWPRIAAGLHQVARALVPGAGRGPAVDRPRRCRCCSAPRPSTTPRC